MYQIAQQLSQQVIVTLNFLGFSNMTISIHSSSFDNKLIFIPIQVYDENAF